MKLLKTCLILFISLSCVYGTCSKDDVADPENNDMLPSATVKINGHKWDATSFSVYTSNTGPAIYFYNNGTTIYNINLKDKYPQLTEELGLAFFTNDIQVGEYIFKYGPGTKGTSTFYIYKDQSRRDKADSSYVLEEVQIENTEYNVTITKVERNKISGTFLLFLFQPITGANSLKIIKCEGSFKNVPFY